MPAPGGLDHDALMGEALSHAHDALAHGDVPVGALAVYEGRVLAARHNEREQTGDPTAHAEMLVLRDVAARLGRWRLDDVTVVVTLEPCPMCAGALLGARVQACVFGAFDMKAGALTSLYGMGSDPRLHHEFDVVGGVRAEECGRILSDFFAGRRD